MKKFYCLFHSITLLLLLQSWQLQAQELPSATETAKAITIGWNLGNSLEAIGGETQWGNPLVTQQLIDSVKAAGFNTIRIPCSWHMHADTLSNTINVQWLARVKEVVDYCIGRDLYVILNIHWDNGWLENNVTETKKSQVNIRQKAYWTQIANYFKSYDGHLLFAGANEPNVDDAAQMAVLLSYHQTFVNAVRATGGNNTSRTLIVQGPRTDIEKTNNLMTTLPTDVVADRLIVEIHYYTPYNFCLMTEDADWGKQFYYWGKNNHSATDPGHNPTYGEEADVDKLFNLMKTKYVDKGIPVIMGEFGAIKRTNLTGEALRLHIASREYFYKYVSAAVLRNGMKLIYWDAGFLGNNSMSLFNRNNGAIVDRGAVNALMQGANVITSSEEEMVSVPHYTIYPNPYTDIVNISGNFQNVKSLELYDARGILAERQQVTAGQSVVSMGEGLPAGQYLLKLTEENSVHTYMTIKK